MAQREALDLDRFRTQLAAEKARLEGDLATYRERVAEVGGGLDEPGNRWETGGTVFGDHLADDATELFEREKDLGLEQTLEQHLQQVTDALARIEAGTYGTCETCGKPIARGRLEAMPEAAQCIDCKTADEARRPRDERPVESR
jgi:DnaK suppressor protein